MRLLIRKFRRVGLGGTFDRLHAGHKALLRKAFEVSEKVIIGVATERLLERKIKKEMIHPYEKRVSALKVFLASEDYLDRAEVVPISEPFGTAADDPEMEAVVVSEETARVVRQINQARRANGLHPVRSVVIKMVLDKDGRPIKSTRLREREASTKVSL